MRNNFGGPVIAVPVEPPVHLLRLGSQWETGGEACVSAQGSVACRVGPGAAVTSHLTSGRGG